MVGGFVRAQPCKFARRGHVWTVLCRVTNAFLPDLNLLHLYWHKISILNVLMYLFLYIWSGVVHTFALLSFASVVFSTAEEPPLASSRGRSFGDLSLADSVVHVRK